MASGLELLQIAQSLENQKVKTSKSGQLASILQNAIEGGFEGFANKTKSRDAALDRTIKIMDLQAKIADNKQKAINRKISNNFAKRLGLLGLDDDETGNARDAALNTLGSGQRSPDNTKKGKLSSKLNVGGTELNIVPSFTTNGGLQFSLKPGNAGKDIDLTSRNKRIRDAARDAARREKFALTQAGVPEDQEVSFSDIQVTEDEIEKYIPEVTSFLEGRKGEARSTKRRRTRKRLLKSGKDLTEEIDVLKKKQSDFIPFNQEDKKLAGLENRRKFLFEQSNIPALVSDIKTEMARLNQDPKTNRERIKQLTRELIQLNNFQRSIQ